MRLFSSVSLGRLQARNRIVRSATHEGMADEQGYPTPKLIQLLKRLGEGGTGTIISGHAYVLPEGRASRWQLGVSEDDHVPGIRRLTEAVHETPETGFILQIAHAGARAEIRRSSHAPAGPSAGIFDITAAREMSEADIASTIGGFKAAAVRAQKAGCDGVQIHAAHGYLLSTFLSPLFNRRTDQWGGTTENRARIVLSIVSEIRQATGPDFPVLIKMNAADFVAGGLETEEMIIIADMLKEAGIDAIEISGGTPLSGPRNPIRVGDNSIWYEDAARALKHKLDIPLILVGGIRDTAAANALLEEGVCDAVALSRPLIREPDLPNSWQQELKTAADCISCNRCFTPMRQGAGLFCPELTDA